MADESDTGWSTGWSDVGNSDDPDSSNGSPQRRRWIRSVRGALRATMEELGDLQEYMADHSLADSFKERVSLQRGALARLLKDVAGWRSGAESSPHESEPDSRGSSTGHSRRRRLREALRARRVPSVQELAGLARGKASALSLKASALSDKVQRVMTSSKVRQYWAEQRNKPAVVRLLDKFSFLFGCLTLTGSEYVLCRYPSLFWAWYLFFMSVMLSSRVPDYRRKNWGYFLLDFCYFAQACNFIQILFFPDSCSFFKVNFAFAMGPLNAAVILWRNSLVFHDQEKVITVWIHVLPSWLVYASKWQAADPATSFSGRLASLETCSPLGLQDVATALMTYALWQALYFWKTEVQDAASLNADFTTQTSLRWLALDTQRPIHQVVLGLVRKLGVQARDEAFCPTTTKTKVIFMLSQFGYTALTLLPTMIAWKYYAASSFQVFAIFCVACFNGGEYYIEVFSRRYYRQFESEMAATVVEDDNEAPPGGGVTGVEAPPPGYGHVIAEPPPIVSDGEPYEETEEEEESEGAALRASWKESAEKSPPLSSARVRRRHRRANSPMSPDKK